MVGVVGQLDGDISMIGCGHGHSIALTKQGRLYGWGSNQMGQLGQGKDNNQDQQLPK